MEDNGFANTSSTMYQKLQRTDLYLCNNYKAMISVVCYMLVCMVIDTGKYTIHVLVNNPFFIDCSVNT